MVAGNGDRHAVEATGLFTRRIYASAGRAVQAGCGTWIWGQTRCPIYRSGTFNAQRSTLNVQWGDRKGAWWARYGDRHGIWATGLLARVDLTERRSGGRGRLRHLDMGTGTMSDIPIRNV